MEDLNNFIDRLSSETVDVLVVTNMYFWEDGSNRARISNLRKYLNYFSENKPKLILVGEAPGYRGCCVSGIPLTSTGVMKTVPFFKEIGITEVKCVQDESTASIVWNYLNEKGAYPLFWNAYPFHPHKKNNSASNRKPTKSELEVGKRYLKELMAIFPDAQLVAVGKVAQESLWSEGIDARCIRHPAFGGKAEFIRGLEELLN